MFTLKTQYAISLNNHDEFLKEEGIALKLEFFNAIPVMKFHFSEQQQFQDSNVSFNLLTKTIG
jgi:hypothetical protein